MEICRTMAVGAKGWCTGDNGTSEARRDGSLVITALKQGVKNPERVNVFINGKFSFSLDVAQVVDFKLKVGLEIDETKLGELKKASEFGKVYQRTLEWVLVRPRSERETRIYLQRKKLKMPSSGTRPRARLHGARTFTVGPAGPTNPSEGINEVFAPEQPKTPSSGAYSSAEFSEGIVSRLVEKGYLDDRKFAEWYVENRFVKKGVSRKRLKMELRGKGVAAEIIDEVLGARDDEAEIRKIIARKRGKYDDEKLLAYLCRQGFSYELAKNALTEE